MENTFDFGFSRPRETSTFDRAQQPQPRSGSLTPRWIRSDGDLTLVLVRNGVVAGQEIVEWLELDWNVLRADLLRSINDVLPNATLAPSNTTSLGAYRMATIPAVLVPPPMQTQLGWTCMGTEKDNTHSPA